MDIIRLVLLLICFSMTQPALAKIYTWKDDHGKVHYTDYPPPASGTPIDKKEHSNQLGADKSQHKPNSLGLASEIDLKNGVFLQVREMLEQKRFAELNRILHSYQRAFEANPSAENTLFQLYFAFGKNDPTFEVLCSDWVAAYPENYQPYLARARYFYDAGWNARGTKWASETTQTQFRGMARYFEKARADLAMAVSIYGKTIVPYTMLIGMANAQSMDNEAKQSLNQALEINPATLKVRETYIRMLAPRWGGSYEQMEAFVNESLAYGGRNPRLQLLAGYIFDDLASVQVRLKKFSEAEDLYGTALSYGENHVILFHKGRANHRAENYEDALRDLNRAIAINKDNCDYYYWRARTYYKLEQFDRAASDIKYAAKLDPNDEYINKLRASIAHKIALQAHELEKHEQTSEALDRYQRAIEMEPENAIMRYNRALTLIQDNQLDLALTELEKAIELDPDEINFYVAIDSVLARNRQWDRIIGYWDTFIINHPNNSRAYLERAGAYHHKGDQISAIGDLEAAANMGNKQAQQLLSRFR